MGFRVLSVVGARPQFIKAAMLSKALAHAGITEIGVHTGQHYDENMSHVFFEQMHIPKPKYNLQVGSDSHGRQTGQMMIALDGVLETERPDAVLVYGDTNSTVAAALCAVKFAIPVIHVEAGMRSFNIFQPEEANRVVTDHLCALLLCSSESSAENLRKEGITKDIVVTGDIMYDSTLAFSSAPSTVLSRLGMKEKSYALVTCHRPESTNTKEHLANIVDALCALNEPVVFPLHPRTKKYLHAYGLQEKIAAAAHITLLEPLGYVDMLHLLQNARILITDSGGLQKEAYFLSVPCVTLREYTEWTELVDAGWNVLAGYDTHKILQTVQTLRPPREHPQLFGNGKAAHAMSKAIHEHLSRR